MVANRCPACHFDNPETAKFCGECGTPLPPSKDYIPVATETLRTPVKELARGSLFARRFEVIEAVALKHIKPKIAAEHDFIDRFRSELKMSRKISHRNVSRMYHLSEEQVVYDIVMEFVPWAEPSFSRLALKIGRNSWTGK